MGLTRVIVFAFLVTCFGYYFHTPLPENISEPWKLKVILAGYRLAHLLSSIGEEIGYDSNLNISRVLFGISFKLTSQTASSSGLEIEDTEMATVPVRVYRPQSIKENAPVLIYFHGGGMITFSIDTYDNVLRTITREVNAVVVSVGYRLAPEHRYPAAVDDCYSVTLHVLQNAEKYGGDRSRVAIAGDSAGGNLAAAVSWRLAYDTPTEVLASLPKTKLQVLLYPMLQAFDFALPSYIEEDMEIAGSGVIAGCWYIYCTGDIAAPVNDLLANNHTTYTMKTSIVNKYVDPMLIEHAEYKKPPRATTKLFNAVLSRKLSSCITKPDFSPLLAEDLSKFPSTYILSAEHDILRDESFIFESRLKSAGVNVMHDHIVRGWHGVVSYTRTNLGQEALHIVINYLKTHL